LAVRAANADADDDEQGFGGGSQVVIFAPSMQLSVTIESSSGGDEIHVHPAGQGFWVARMLHVLGGVPLLCSPLGGETGTALRALLADHLDEGFLACAQSNGCYVHDRRSGERAEVAWVRSAPLDRHVVDDLISTTLAYGIGARVSVVCGTNLEANIDPVLFGHVCADLRAGGSKVVADLAGDELREALNGGIDVLKLSDEEMVQGGWSPSDERAAVIEGLHRLHAAGAVDVVVSCGDDGALALIDGAVHHVRAPSLSVVEHRGAGDSMTAGIAFALGAGGDMQYVLRLSSAAAALNVTRHGLASGDASAIQQLMPLVEIETVE
jgi:1-phosphofructokinase